MMPDLPNYLQLSERLEVEVSDTSAEITSADDLIRAWRELTEMSKTRLALEKREKLVKTKCGEYLKSIGKKRLFLGNGLKAEQIDSIVNVKPNVPLEELPEFLKVTRINHSLVKKLWAEEKLNESLFSYDEKTSIKVLNC